VGCVRLQSIGAVAVIARPNAITDSDTNADSSPDTITAPDARTRQGIYRVRDDYRRL
jgi:hypothetical protein